MSEFPHRVDDVFDRLSIARAMLFECHNTEVMCQLVAAGLGVSLEHPFVRRPPDDSFVIRSFEPAIRMEYAMFRQPRGEFSNACEVLAEHILKDTHYLREPKPSPRKGR